MKKLLTVTIVSLLCFSMFSTLVIDRSIAASPEFQAGSQYDVETYSTLSFASEQQLARIYVDPSSCVFYSNETAVGTRFNVTMWVENVVDLAGAQVCMEFDDSIINVTRWFEPTNDRQYIFYGRTTSALPPPPQVHYRHILPSLGWTIVAVNPFPTPPDQPSFNGTGKICILEMEITAEPPPAGVLACLLRISVDETYLLDSDMNEIVASKTDGSYIYYSSAPPGVHDIAVLGVAVSKTVVGQGYWVVVDIIVANAGDYSEVFNVTAYAGSSIIYTMYGVQLAPDSAAWLRLVWNTVECVKGSYTVSAYASPVQGESNVDNNMCVAGNVLVTIPGDVNGDHKVGLKDIFAIALAFGSTTWSPRYRPNVDINGDGKINLKDYFIASKNFGQQW